MNTRQLTWMIRVVIGAKVSKRRVRRAIAPILSAQLPETCLQHPPVASAKDGILRVAAVQMELRMETTVLDFVRHVHELVRDAVSQGAELIVFPENTPTGMVGMIPGVEQWIGESWLESHDDTPVSGDAPVAGLFRSLSPYLHHVYTACFEALASQYHVYIVAGSGMFALDGQKVTNTAHVFGPKGLIGMQHKLHCAPLEKQWGLVEGSQLYPIDLPKVRIASPLCMDANFYEVFRIAAAKGTQLIVLPAATPDRYNFWRSLRGIQTRIDENAMYGVQSCMVGSFFGLPLEGRSVIVAPYDMTETDDGILTQASDASTEQVVVTSLSLGALEEYRQQFAATYEPNTILYRHYYKRFYE